MKVKDAKGKVTCPILRNYICPLCNSTGDFAHTIKYCPNSTNVQKNSFNNSLEIVRNQLTLKPRNLSQTAIGMS